MNRPPPDQLGYLMSSRMSLVIVKLHSYSKPNTNMTKTVVAKLLPYMNSPPPHPITSLIASIAQW